MICKNPKCQKPIPLGAGHYNFGDGAYCCECGDKEIKSIKDADGNEKLR